MYIYKHKHTMGPNALYTMCYFSNTRSHTRARASTYKRVLSMP